MKLKIILLLTGLVYGFAAFAYDWREDSPAYCVATSTDNVLNIQYFHNECPFTITISIGCQQDTALTSNEAMRYSIPPGGKEMNLVDSVCTSSSSAEYKVCKGGHLECSANIQ